MLIGQMGEEGLLKELRALFAVTAEGVPLGIGDDAAVIEAPAGQQLVWTTDLLLEGIHFEKQWQSPRLLGGKCLAVNLSDIASMGAIPGYVLISLACPPDLDTEYILELARGVRDLALRHGVAVIGGDTSASPGGIILSVTAGGLVEAGKALRRSGARPGDAILVTGFLGSAAGGLRLLQGGIAGGYDSIRQAFISPQPMIAAGRLAAKSGATAMTDLSDGLASDLRHICAASSAGARIERDRLPVHPELLEASRTYGWDLESLILSGGEDYGLLFSMPAAPAGAVAANIEEKTGVRVSVIGEITSVPEIKIFSRNGRVDELPLRGYDHFLPPA